MREVVIEPGPQPGGRRPAPGELGLVQAFVNSYFDLEVEHGADLLAEPEQAQRWLSARGLLEPGASMGDEDHLRVVSVRRGLRALLRANAGLPLDAQAVDELNRAAEGAAVQLGLSPAGASMRPAAGGVDGALALVLGVAARAMLEGTWVRFKICREHDCGWAFYDHSRNQAGEWCSMAVCGSRVKARAYYRRRRSRGDGAGARAATAEAPALRPAPASPPWPPPPPA